MKIGIFGVGYVGLVTGACLSDFGHDVICIDKDVNKIKNLRNNLIPIYEPGLDMMVERNANASRLKFEDKLGDYIKELEIIFIAVGTPPNEIDGGADLSNLIAVVETLGGMISTDQVLVIKSTVPVGTNKKISELLTRKKKGNVEIVSNPEFLREGSAIEDFMRPDRVIVGLRTERAKKIMTEVYKSLYLRDFPIMFTDPQSAEVIKYAANAFLATKISFINEIAFLCEKVDGDVKEVSKGIGLDKRIGKLFLHAGPGFGGSCFPKDTLALEHTGLAVGAPQNIVKTVIETNLAVKNRMVSKIIDACRGNVKDLIISILGVTFKPNTDDIRDAPSLTIIDSLQKKGATLRIYDPKGMSKAKKVFKNVVFCDDSYHAAEGADLIVILTEWNEFRALNLNKIATAMRRASMVDLRNIYSEKEVTSFGFKEYFAVGR